MKGNQSPPAKSLDLFTKLRLSCLEALILLCNTAKRVHLTAPADEITYFSAYEVAMTDQADVFSASTPSSPAIWRSATLPLRPSTSSTSNHSAYRASQDPAGLQIFYVHPSVRIVKFEPLPDTPNGAPPPIDRRHRRVDSRDEQGTLPYSSPFEQTMAVGPLRMYRTMQGFAMLSCGSGKCIRPIMPKSKSWCVDDASSKFIFPVGRTPQGPPVFWRMELPVEFPDHEAKSAELKEVLAEISQFEKAACPFVRNFHVELPAPPEVPIKKKPWKPVERPSTAPDGSAPVPTPGSLIEDKRNQRRSSTQHESGYFTPPVLRTFGPSSAAGGSDAINNPNVTARGYRRSSLSRPESSGTGRSVTAPHLTATSHTSGFLHKTPLGPPIREESQISQMSDETTREPPSTPPPRTSTPVMHPYQQENITLSKRANRQDAASAEPETEDKRNTESPTASPKTPRVWQMLDGTDEDSTDSGNTRPSSPLAPRTPSPMRRMSTEEEYFDVSASPSIHAESPSTPRRIRGRAERTDSESSATAPRTPLQVPERQGRRPSMPSTERARNHRALSPLPSAAVLFTPTKARALQTARHLPTAIIQKTWEILLSPPNHLVEMILQVAARVAQRLRNGQTWDGEPETDCEDDLDDEEDEEDDYGMPIKFTRTNSTASMRSKPLDELVKVGSRERWNMPGAWADLD